MGDVCKPEVAAFQKAFEISGASPKTSAMLEDSFKNLRTAKSLGMTTILVVGETAAEENVTKYLFFALIEMSHTARGWRTKHPGM